MSLYQKLRGTMETLLQIGLGGPQVKNNAGVIEHRNATDTGFVVARGAAPVASNDFVTLGSVAPGAYPPNVLPPAVATLTWVQQAGLNGGAASAADDSFGGFTMLSPIPGDNALCIHAKVAALPAAPWTATIAFIPDGLANLTNWRVGVVLYESATTKMLVANLSDQTTGVAVSSWTNPTTQVSEDYMSTLVSSPLFTQQGYNQHQPIVTPFYIKIHNDGTSLFFYISYNGTVFTSLALSASDGNTPVGAPLTDFFT
jgi:hypothetical protein